MSNDEQIAYWNGEAGQKWAQKDGMMAQMLSPIAEELMAHAAIKGSRAVVDVGCGGGSETVLLADHLGPQAKVLGVDISAPLLDVARERLAERPELAARVDFLQADAAMHAFTPGSFDLLFSRFGVMFFDDPEAAFRNLRSALAANGRLAFTCWQKMDLNPWVVVPLRAALQHVPAPEPPAPNAPGPFAFASTNRIQQILQSAGFTDIDVAHHDLHMRWGNNGDLASSARELLNIGPVGRLLADQDDEMRQRIYASAIEAMAPFFQDGQLSLRGAVWFVTARNGR